jgi:hypothetical protein
MKKIILIATFLLCTISLNALTVSAAAGMTNEFINLDSAKRLATWETGARAAYRNIFTKILFTQALQFLPSTNKDFKYSNLKQNYGIKIAAGYDIIFPLNSSETAEISPEIHCWNNMFDLNSSYNYNLTRIGIGTDFSLVKNIGKFSVSFCCNFFYNFYNFQKITNCTSNSTEYESSLLGYGFAPSMRFNYHF